jgi:hypothetical protein
MGTALIYWILMFLWLIFGFWWNWPGRPAVAGPWGPLGNTFLLWILMLILGWHSFGPPIHFN